MPAMDCSRPSGRVFPRHGRLYRCKSNHANGSFIRWLSCVAGGIAPTLFFFESKVLEVLLINIEAQNSVPVTAVLDFYGGKYYSDPSWHSPTPFFANAPDYPDSLTQEAFSGPQISAAVPSVGGSEISPRDAWLSNAFKSGQHLSLVTKDGNYDRIDPSKGFSANFPPTMFIHGTADTVTPFRLSERAHEELKRLGVESHLLPVVNENHMFDMLLSERDDAYQTYVMPGLKFLATKAGLSYHGLG